MKQSTLDKFIAANNNRKSNPKDVESSTETLSSVSTVQAPFNVGGVCSINVAVVDDICEYVLGEVSDVQEDSDTEEGDACADDFPWSEDRQSEIDDGDDPDFVASDHSVLKAERKAERREHRRESHKRHCRKRWRDADICDDDEDEGNPVDKFSRYVKRQSNKAEPESDDSNCSIVQKSGHKKRRRNQRQSRKRQRVSVA